MPDPPLSEARPILLVGMMGAGKSTVGPILAKLLELAFFDCDEEVERSTGRTVAEIFAGGGEAAFRAKERRVIRQLLAGPASVIAAGGGALLDEGTRALILERSTMVWLKASVATLARRLAGTSHRPLLTRGEPQQMLRRLLEEREHLYAAAPVRVETDGQTPAEVAACVARLIPASQPRRRAEHGPGADCPE